MKTKAKKKKKQQQSEEPEMANTFAWITAGSEN